MREIPPDPSSGCTLLTALRTRNEGSSPETREATQFTQNHNAEQPPHVKTLPAAVIAEAREGFVLPGRMREARKLARKGIVFLIEVRGTGGRTTALNLLAESGAPQRTVHELAEGFDFSGWLPDRPDGYFLEGKPRDLLESATSVRELASRLRAAQANLVVILPSDLRLTDDVVTALGPSLVRCLPPDPQHVLTAALTTKTPCKEARRTLLRSLPDGFLTRLLPPWASPQDAVDLAEALMRRASRTGLTPDGLQEVRAELDQRADREVRGLLAAIGSRELAYLLISAAVFAGLRLEIIVAQARRLARRCEGSDPALFYDGGTRALAELSRVAPIRIEPTGRGEDRLIFFRCDCSRAVLRQTWQSPLAQHVASWLASLAENDLIEHAGRALALSVPARLRPFRPTHIRACALSRGPLAPHVAATALRVILRESANAREAAKALAGWTWGDSERLCHVTALACGGTTETASVRLVLTLLRRLVRRLADHCHQPTDDAVHAAILAQFRAGNRTVVLAELAAWTVSGDVEAAYATRIFPRLLRADLAWFHAQAQVPSASALIAVLIQRTVRLHGPGGRVRDSIATWQRHASRNRVDADAFAALLTAVGADRHRHVQAFLSALRRHL